MKPSVRRAVRRSSAVAVGLALATGLSACSGIPGLYMVEKSGDAASASGAAGGAFDAAGYVNSIWEAKVVPTVTDGATDAPTLLADIAKDADAAGRTHGRQAGAGGPFTFDVKGTGTVTEVDTSGPSGLAKVDLAPGDGTPDLAIALGPALLGTAIRDSLPFIDFSQFTNQIDYADVGTALNSAVKTKVLAGVTPEAVKGKKVTFVGAFALLDPKNIVVTPVTFQAGP